MYYCRFSSFADRKPYPIAHLDLKSPNVLLIADEGPVKIQAKISDFGTSQVRALIGITATEFALHRIASIFAINLSFFCLHFECCVSLSSVQEVVKPITIRKVDNPTWCAPEVIKGLPYDQRADVYSFGVICWELLTREKYYGEISVCCCWSDNTRDEKFFV